MPAADGHFRLVYGAAVGLGAVVAAVVCGSFAASDGRLLADSWEKLRNLRFNVEEPGILLLEAILHVRRMTAQVAAAAQEVAAMYEDGTSVDGLVLAILRACHQLLVPMVTLLGLALVLLVPLLIIVWFILSSQRAQLDFTLAPIMEQVAPIFAPVERLMKPLVYLLRYITRDCDELLTDEAERSPCLRLKRALLGQVVILVLLSSLVVAQLALLALVSPGSLSIGGA
eukprot:TRINITY_DN120847_c0_g1_i1.p1 TRINITY_DN120847_c0_g1~~TRINITY_DN120847_c0_g1_i1.p1  ORF type:complete len:228 (+),score=52.79 TRINITY_DN120847_c0_g1_i1:115-798(+)